MSASVTPADISDWLRAGAPSDWPYWPEGRRWQDVAQALAAAVIAVKALKPDGPEHGKAYEGEPDDWDEGYDSGYTSGVQDVQASADDAIVEAMG